MSRRLLVFAPNWLGDAVMALPAIADLCRVSPDAVVHVAARPAIAPLVPLMPGIAQALVLGDRRASIDAVRAGRYDAALLLPNSFHTAWIARNAGVPERWGYRNEFRAMLLTRAVAPPVRVHQAAYYQRLTTALGCPPGPLTPRLDLPHDLRSGGGNRLAAAGWDGQSPLVALAPGAAFGGAKRWPAAHFAATADALARDGVRSVLVGAGADARAGAEVEVAVRSGLRPINLIGATDLPGLAAVLVQCRALVTNDSGAMHFAAALGVNVAAVFGPTNEHETYPLGTGRLSVLHTDVWCRPCMLRECPLTHRCMTGISADTVLGEVRVSL
ncbi:MAG TPA: lipopolysaccharide heptosyltransferase II [Vicinamibacterales bacterium]|nr:lipopolysaccharide heptosyltransferase II [Vicinamibacterales bacterium]